MYTLHRLTFPAPPPPRPSNLSNQPLPMLEWLEVDILLINPAYQRDISAPSLKLIASLIEGWDWLKMAPLLVAMTENGLEVVDGQNRATAAKMHPGITKVPCYVVDGSTLPERAGAFVSHAKNKVAVTPGQVYHAEIAAGDETALTVDAVCRRAGVRILPFSPPYATGFQIGDTTALASVKVLVNRRGAMRAREVLEALVKADLAPISAAHIRAGEVLCCDAEYAAEFGPEQLTNAIRALGKSAVAEVTALAAAKNLPLWRAWASVLFKHRKIKPKTEAGIPATPSTPAHDNSSSRASDRAPTTQHVRSNSPMRRVIDRRPEPGSTVYLGEPAPGRSALDQRTAGV